MDSIIKQLDSFNESFYEKIAVELNKEVYRPYDAVWFKAYLVGVSDQGNLQKIILNDSKGLTKISFEKPELLDPWI